MTEGSIIVVGSFVQDLAFHCTEFPQPGETVVGQFVTGPGGKGSNQAVAAARAGGKVTFIGAVGGDAFGLAARTFQEAEGIRSLLVEKAGQPTGVAGILVNAQGENEIIVSLNANASLAPEDIEARRQEIGAAKLLATQLEANLEATAHALRIAHETGLITVLNPAPMRRELDLSLLAHASVLIPNETEFAALVRLLPNAQALVGNDFNEETLHRLTELQLHQLCRCLGVETIVVTLGARGCFLSEAERCVLVPALPGIKAIDTTGAGDAFVGAMAAALADWGLGEIERAARFANAAAALSVTRPGAASAMPRRAEIDALLRPPPG